MRFTNLFTASPASPLPTTSSGRPSGGRPSSPLSRAFFKTSLAHRFGALALPAMLITMSSGNSLAQEYPSRPVRLILAYPAGGPSDAIGRKLGDLLQKQTGQPFILDFHSGAGGSIGADVVAKSAPDGYTLLLTIPDPVINVTSTIKRLPYDPQKDFTFITQVASGALVLMARAELKVNSLADLENLAAEKKGVPYGSWGPGSSPNVLGQAMAQKSGMKLLHVPYRGIAPAVQDLLAGQIAFTFGPANLALQYAEKGHVTLVAVAGPRRSPLLPQVPTFAEQGYSTPAFLLAPWVGLMAPARTPDAVVRTLQQQVAIAVKEPDFVKFVTDMGFVPMGSTSQKFKEDYQREFPLINNLIKSTGLEPQ